MERDKVIDKVQKLLRLSKSSNEHEAARAAAAAQALMSKFEIEEAQLLADTGEKDAPVEEDVFAVWGTRRSLWRGDLAFGFAQANGIKAFWCDHRLKSIGRKADIAAARYLTNFVVNEIERLAREHGRGQSVAWRNSFKVGAANTVRARVQAEAAARRAAERANPNMTQALVVIDRRALAIQQHAMKAGYKFSTARGASFSSLGGYYHGVDAGRHIPLGGRATAAIGAGSARLGS